MKGAFAHVCRCAACAAGLFTSAVGTAEGAARLVFDGTIGQFARQDDKVTVPWTGCAWVATDRDGTLHLPGSLALAKGATRLTRTRADYPGTLVTDGNGDFFSFAADGARVGKVLVTRNALKLKKELGRLDAWQIRLHVAPGACRRGFAATARFFALDREAKEVRAWTDDLKPCGVVFGYRERGLNFSALAIEPTSGDLFLGVGWPENAVHRFRPDGTEVTDALWPFKTIVYDLKNVGTDTWCLGDQAVRLPKTHSPRERCAFGIRAKRVTDIARTDGGYWLATTQGAQFYADADLSRCARRLGGVGPIDTLGLLGGRIIATEGAQIWNFWLDDTPGDALDSDGNWDWQYGNAWNARASAVAAKDGRFYFRDAAGGQTVAFDPSVVQWAFRARRLFAAPDAKVRFDAKRVRLGRRHAAVATDRGIKLYRRADDGSFRCVQLLPDVATLLAAEGAWLVAYVPARHALCRYWLQETGNLNHPENERKTTR